LAAVGTSHEIPFQLELPIKVWEKAGEPGKERRIGGLISTEHQDKQGEVVLQRGLDFKDFLSSGWLNDNHSKETTGIVGYPIKVSKTTHEGKPATYMEGYLLPEYDRASEIWELAQSLQKTNRRLGFSIEGKVKQRTGRDGKTIARAHVTNVAVTNCPVNTMTGLDLIAKSMMALEHHGDGREPCSGSCPAHGIHKALAAGQAVDVPAAPAAGDGFALRTESLEGPVDTKKRKKKKKKRLSKAEALGVIRQRHPGLTPEAVERIWHFAKTQGA